MLIWFEKKVLPGYHAGGSALWFDYPQPGDQTSGNIFLEGFDVGAEGFHACLGDGAGGAGLFALEALLDRDVTGGRELVDLDAELPEVAPVCCFM